MSGPGGQTPFGPVGVMRNWLRPPIRSGDKGRQGRRGVGSWWAWVVFILGFLYFFLPLVATLQFSFRARPFGQAYVNSIEDPRFLSSLGYSFFIAIVTIIVSLAIIVPTAYWVRLRMPRLRPVIELITLLPFVVPPVVLVFGMIRVFSQRPLQLAATDTGLTLMLIGAYVVLSFPYMYRAVDTGLSAIDVRSLTEAAQSLGASWPRIILRVIIPNLRVAIVAGAFLTLAIVVGEYTIASFMARPAFGPYLSELGQNKAYEPAALSLISFGLTWFAMGVISLLGRGSRQRVQVAGAR
jgi:putative spermidine/putrescine transport system permease protein